MKLFYTLLAALCIAQLQAAETTKNVDLNQVSVELLKDHPEHIETLVKIWHEAVGKVRHPDFEKVKDAYNKVLTDQMNNDQLPLALVALLDSKPIGVCALRDACIPRKGACVWSDENPDKKPWLALFVATEYQKQEVGTKLIKQVFAYAQEKFGFSEAYFMPENEEAEKLYTRKGAEKIADTMRDGKPAVIMKIAFDKVLKENV